MKAILSFLLFLFTIASFGQTPKTDSEKLVGKWVSHDDGYPMEADFKANGSGVVDGDVLTWSVKSGVLFITVDGDKKTYNLSLTENEFRVSGGDLERPMKFKRVTSGNASGNSNSKTSAPQKNLDRTLVGKWCYVNVASNYSTSSER